MKSEMVGPRSIRPSLPGSDLGAGPFACLAGIVLAVLILFRPQIGRLLDRTVYLRVFGIRLLAEPRRPGEDAPPAHGATRPCPRSSGETPPPP